MTVPTTSIVVVDDHNLFRAGLIELLDSVPDFAVSGDGGSGVDAITLAQEHQPDVVLLDVEMPGPAAPVTIRKISETSPHSKVVVLTMHDDPEILVSLIDAGAAGYLLKSAGRDELMTAINAARRNDGSVLICVSRKTLLNMGRHTSGPVPAELLSEREIEVVRHLADGGRNRDIAAALFITEATVKRHLANIYAKLGATSRIDAVRRATRRGIIGNVLTSKIAPAG